jgi:hypothetical protein
MCAQRGLSAPVRVSFGDVPGARGQLHEPDRRFRLPDVWHVVPGRLPGEGRRHHPDVRPTRPARRRGRARLRRDELGRRPRDRDPVRRRKDAVGRSERPRRAGGRRGHAVVHGRLGAPVSRVRLSLGLSVVDRAVSGDRLERGHRPHARARRRGRGVTSGGSPRPDLRRRPPRPPRPRRHLGEPVAGRLRPAAFRHRARREPSVAGLPRRRHRGGSGRERVQPGTVRVAKRTEARSWELVGDAMRTGASELGTTSLAIDATGQPVVAWEESAEIHVARFDGSSWKALGGAVGDATLPAFTPALAMGPPAAPHALRSCSRRRRRPRTASCARTAGATARAGERSAAGRSRARPCRCRRARSPSMRTVRRSWAGRAAASSRRRTGAGHIGTSRSSTMA